MKTDDVRGLKNMLTLIFTPERISHEEEKSEDKPILDIIMTPLQDALLKIWIVSCDENDNPLLKTYFNKPFSCNYKLS
jgi:hypothetical protein